MGKLVPVSIEQFDREWPFYAECLSKIKDKRGGTWQPRHVFAAVRNREAFVYAAPEGFVIFRAEQDAYSYERILLVWIAYGESRTSLIRKYWDQAMELGRENGFDRIEFYRSPRVDVAHSIGSERMRRAHSVYSIDLRQ